MTKWPKPSVLLSVVLLCLVSGLARPVAAAEDKATEASMPEYATRGAESCMRCHDEPPATLILHTPHAQQADPRTPFAGHQCETCHGASPEHMRNVQPGKKRIEPKVVFGVNAPTPAREQNAVCLSCHQGGLRMHWAGSQHDFADVPCAACHNIHALQDKVLAKKTQAQVCFDCHLDKKVESRKRSHHPIQEGKVVCSDCHNPHGSFGPKLLVKQTVNETCYQCHADKRGPFLWEHPPVREDCTLCHKPHGSTQVRLLKFRLPFLCQTCHSEAHHPSTLYSGTGLPTASPGSRVLAKQCLNCHSQVHGTNHPSGPRLTR